MATLVDHYNGRELRATLADHYNFWSRCDVYYDARHFPWSNSVFNLKAEKDFAEHNNGVFRDGSQLVEHSGPICYCLLGKQINNGLPRVTITIEPAFDDYLVVATAADKQRITSHVSSDQVFAKHDIMRFTHLQRMAAYYPAGFQLVWGC